jgi:pimeloyl-ACP methyl ester carboxylesterase
VRFVSVDRPGYGGSTAHPERAVADVAADVAADAAADVAAVLDAVGVVRVHVMGHSGGGPHALACVALLPDRVHALAWLVDGVTDHPGG